jgi:clusterin-associated protein 1
MAEDEEDGTEGEGFSLNMKASELAATRAMAAEVTERGARLYDLLRRDGEVRDARAAALRFLDAVNGSLDSRAESEYLERSVRDAIASLKDGVGVLETQLAELAEDEKNVDGKVRKKRAELERHQKRLESLQSVR